MNKAEKIQRLREGGESVKDIAKKLFISTGRVYQIITNQRKCFNQNEEEVRDSLINEGWLVLKNGYPDFFCYNPATNLFKFVEVKGSSDGLRSNQKVMIEYLKKAGFVVEIIKTLTNEKKYKKMRKLGKRSWAVRKEKLLKVGNNKPK